MVLFNVTFNQKDSAKEMGLIYDSSAKGWFGFTSNTQAMSTFGLK
jgi:hypothetical protein